jgi:hypothetical protein
MDAVRAVLEKEKALRSDEDALVLAVHATLELDGVALFFSSTRALLVLLCPCSRRCFKPKQIISALPASSSVCHKLLIVLARLHARSLCVRFCLCSFAYA